MLMAVSILVRFIVTIASGPAFAGDSSRYVRSDLNGAGIDLLGSQGHAAPLVQMVWALPTRVALVLQASISAAAWCILAFVGLRVIRSRLRATVFVLTLGTMAWWPVVWGFDTLALTESLSISGSLLCVAGAFAILIDSSGSARPWRFGSLSLALGYAIAMTARPVNIVLLLPLCVYALVGRGRPSKGYSFATAAVVVACMSGYGVLLALNASNSVIEDFRSVNRIAWRSSNEYLDAAARNGLVFCEDAQRQQISENFNAAYEYRQVGPLTFRQLGGDRQPQVEFARQYVQFLDCPEVQSWLSSSDASAIRMTLTAPLEMLRQYRLDLASIALTPVPRFSPDLPGEAHRLFYPAVNLSLLVPLAGQAMRSLRRRNVAIDIGVQLSVVAALALLLLSAVAHSFVTWAVDAMEVARHFLPTPVVLGPALLLGVVGLARSETPVVEHLGAETTGSELA